MESVPCEVSVQRVTQCGRDFLSESERFPNKFKDNCPLNWILSRFIRRLKTRSQIHTPDVNTGRKARLISGREREREREREGKIDLMPLYCFSLLSDHLLTFSRSVHFLFSKKGKTHTQFETWNEIQPENARIQSARRALRPPTSRNSSSRIYSTVRWDQF